MKILLNGKACWAGFKKCLGIIAAALCCVMALTAAAFAAGTQKIELRSGSGEAQVLLTFPQAAAEEISSLQIAVSVKASSNKTEIEFVPSSNIPAKIVESRYHSDTGILNIYIAGTEPLFDGSSALLIGKVTVSGASAEIGVVEDSLKFVRGSELVAPFGEIAYPNSVKITPSSSSNQNTSTQAPANPPVSSAQPTVPSDGTAAGSPSQDNDGSITNTNEGSFSPDVSISDGQYYADTTALEEAISIASEFKREDYTQSSFDILTDAINKAKEVLSDPYATQESIDEAMLVLQNAIGTLELQNSTSTDADDTDDDPNKSEEGNGATSSDGQSDNTDTDSQSPENSDGSESDGSDNSPVFWIIILIIVVVLAAGAAVAVVVNLNKKKGKKVNRTKRSD